MNKTCATCKWWNAAEGDQIAECFRYPPAVGGWVPTGEGTRAFANQRRANTLGHDWCGEHTPTDAAALAKATRWVDV